MCADSALRSRNSLDGSLVRLVTEYFALFERGMPSARRVGQKRSAMCTGGSSLDSLLFRETFARKLKAFLESTMVSFTQIGTAFLRTGIKGLTSG